MDDDVLNRTRPALVLLLVAVLLAVHHWWVVTQEEAYFFALLILPALAAVCIAGLIHPPLYWVITPKAKVLPTWTKVAAAVIALIGMAIGIYVFRAIYDFPNPYLPE